MLWYKQALKMIWKGEVDYPCQEGKHSCFEKNDRPDTAVLHHIAERTASGLQPVETVVIQVTDLITSMPE